MNIYLISKARFNSIKRINGLIFPISIGVNVFLFQCTKMKIKLRYVSMIFSNMITSIECSYFLSIRIFKSKTKQRNIVAFSDSYIIGFSWCSGYHICLTHRRSPVRNRAKTQNYFLH